MAVAEEVPVVVGAGLLVCGALHHPRPRALFALEETEIGGIEERARGVVDQRPAAARDEALADGLFGLGAERTVEGARGALQIFGVGVAGMPDDGFAVDGERDGKILRGEAAVAGGRVGEREGCGLDGQRLLAVAVADIVRELRHRQAAIDEDQRGVIFKLAVGRPLHANELRCEHGEARMTGDHLGFSIGNRIVDGLDLRG